MSLVADILDVVRRPSRSRRGAWVGVDIGSAVVKFVELERRGRAVRLARSAIIPRPPSDDGAPRDFRFGLGEMFSEHLAAGNPFAGKPAACVLSMSATPLRTLDLPPGDDEEHREMAAQELEQSPDGNVLHLSVGCWPAPGHA